MAARREDEMEDETSDQTGQNSAGQEDQEPDTQEESNIQPDNTGDNPPANMANPAPASAAPPVDGNEMSSNGNNSSRARRILPCVGVGVATGLATVAATPLVLGAAGFTAGGVAAGSIAASVQSAVYGGSVASGSVFALLQSAGAAGIGAAGNAAIAGTTGSIAVGCTALRNYMLNRIRTGIKLLICGWGSEAHVFSSIALSVNGTEVRVLPDRWSMLTNNIKVTFHRKGEKPMCITSRPPLVTHNPEDAMQDVDIVVFMQPASAHEDFLHVLKPYIKPGVLIVGLPGQPGFEFQVREALGDVTQQCNIMNFESSPWVCCSTACNVDCEVLATKETLLGAIKEDKAPDKPEESLFHQHDAGRGPSTKKSPSATSTPSNNGNNPLVKTSDASSSEVNHSVTSKDTSTNEDKPPGNSKDTSSDEDNPVVHSNSPSSNGDITSSIADNPVNADTNTASEKGNPPVNSKSTSSNGDNPSASNNNTFSPGDSLPVSNKDTFSNDDKPSVNSEDTPTFEVKPPASCADTSRSINSNSSENKPSVKSMGASCDKDQPVLNPAGTSNNEGNFPVNGKDSKPSVNSKDSSSKGVNSPGREKHSAQSGYFGGSMFSWLQNAGNAAFGEITEGIAAIGAKMFDEPEESKPHQDNVEGSSPSAEANASESPTNAPSQNGKNPSVRSEDISSQEDNPPVNRLDTSNHEEKSSGNGEGTSSDGEKPSGNVMNTFSVSDEDSNPKAKKDLGVAAGTAAVVAAPLILGGAGVAVGSIAPATVETGGLFAMEASNAAIDGITGGNAALGAKMSDSFVDIKVLICGSGSDAHAFAAIASSMKGTDVRVFSLNQDEADYWFAATQKNEIKVTFHRKGEEPTCITSKAPLETSNPEDAMQDIDIVAFVLPAFAHQVLLHTLKPYFKPGTIIVGLPGAPGFEFHVQHVLGDVGQQGTIMNFESAPWISCISDFNVGCEVLGTKKTLLGAIKQGKGVNPKKDPVSTLQYLLGSLPKLNVSGHLLGVHLMSVNAYLHTSILYGQWEGWQGKPVDEPPLFYNGLTEPAADLLSSISDEIVNIARIIELKTEADMSHVVHIHLWLVRRYSHGISNKLTLYKAIQTNAAYQGIKHPVKTTEDGKFVPDFTHRYMTEDVPYGLVVIRGIAEIVGVETPNIDKVLSWCQEKMGKEYLVNSKLQGKDVGSSTAPQRYGFTTLESIL